MGYDLSEIRAEVKRRIGNVTQVDVDDDRYDLWINLAYLDMAGTYAFPQLKQLSEATLQTNDRLVSLPSDLFAIYSVRDATNNKKVTKASDIVFDNLDLTSTGAYLEHYQRVGNMLELYPKLSANCDVLIRYCRNFTLLTDDDHEPAFNINYHEGLMMLATAKGLRALFEYKKAMAEKNEYVAFMRSRMYEDEIEDTDNDYAIEVIVERYQ